MKEFEFKLKQAQEFEESGKYLHALQIYVSLLTTEEAKRIATIRIALVYEKMDRNDKACEVIDSYIEQNEDDEEVRKFYGDFLIRRDEYQKALTVLSGVSTENNCEVFFLVGLSNFHLGELQGAQINFESFIKCAPGSELIPQANLYLSKIFLNKREYDSALEFAKKSEDLLTQNFEVHLTQAIIFYCKEMYFHALDSVNRALSLNESDCSVYKWASKINYKLSEYDKAEFYIKEFMTSCEADSESYTILGLTCKGKKNETEAKKYFDKALKLDPNNALASAELNNF